MIRPREFFQTTATAVNKQQTGSSNRTACFLLLIVPVTTESLQIINQAETSLRLGLITLLLFFFKRFADRYGNFSVVASKDIVYKSLFGRLCYKADNRNDNE